METKGYASSGYAMAEFDYNKYGQEELDAASEVLKSGKLYYVFGTRVRSLEDRLKNEYDAAGCSLLSSGTAAVHTALGAVGVDFGDEVITTPLTDTGTVIPIFLQGAIPVFADIDPQTMMITTETIRPVISERTRAIVVVHYGGYPADLDPILELAREHGLFVIEDCAQAHLTFYGGRRAGTLGDCAGFSTNDTKPVSCGDGGFVISRHLGVAERARLFHDKGFDRVTGIRDPEFATPNYRMTELQAAILDRQWNKLEERVNKRRVFAQQLDNILEPIPWLNALKVYEGDSCSYFSYLFSVSTDAPCVRDDLCDALCSVGLPARKGNSYDVQYKLKMFNSSLPRYMKSLSHDPYREGLCPHAEQAQASVVRLEMLETFGEEQAESFATVIQRYNR